MLSLTIDEKSISSALSGQLDLEPIVNDLALPESSRVAKCVSINGHGYILSREMQPDDALLTISLEPDGPLSALALPSRHEAFGRILRCATRMSAGRSRSLPSTWKAFTKKNRLSFQADRHHRKSGGGRINIGRVILELTQESGPRVFAFLLDQVGVQDLSAFRPNLKLLQDASSGVSKAFAQREAEESLAKLQNDVALDSTLPSRVSTHVSYADWYTSRLTKAQRKFADHPLEGSVRLVGPAGSGKTVALIVKCLQELNNPTLGQKPKRFLFLTHALITVSEIEDMVLGMDPDGGLDFLASDQPSLVVDTLYSLANNQMRYDLHDLTPVSLDGYEGRCYQAVVLNMVIEEYRKGDWIAYRSRCSQPFVEYMEAAPESMERRFFLWEILNEFACVLDAEGVRRGSVRREQYLGMKRRKWMMDLEHRDEREVVLSLYDNFRLHLRSEKAIGCDQMVEDFLNHLESFRWEATRDKEGFDVIFVDELHLFNRQERMVFRSLLRDPNAPPTVFMAYDAKQSPRDSFLGMPGEDVSKYDRWRDSRLGKVEKIELIDVFRYTPQITAALRCIDQSFPGQDLDDDWPTYSGVSQTEDGPVPTVCVLQSTAATYGRVFKRARELQGKLGKGRRVAVLCASYELFQRYLDYEDLRDSFYAITSREDASSIPHGYKKFLFSMPEFVAGMQFDTVFLIEVNRSEVPDGPYSSGALRKFISQVYLGASRAERQLEIYSSLEHGGTAPFITLAVHEGAIKTVNVADIR